jgi:tripartite-type tricarboxylate transporter receptor subunit TctC
MTRRKASIAGIVAALVVAAQPLRAQETYPNKPIRMVIGLAPGGAVELTGRRLAQKLTEQMGTSVFIDHKPGANSAIAHDYVAKSKPDGYTIIFNSGSLVQSHALYQVNYDPVRDFAAVALVSSTPLTIVVNANSPYKSISEFLAFGKANPGKLTYGTAGTGNITHLAGELFLQTAGISALHVPYQGSGPALIALTGGQIAFSTASVTSIVPAVKAKRLHALAVMDTKRAPSLPDAPTLGEGGVQNVAVASWVGLMAPAGTPEPIVRRLNAETVKALQDPELRGALTRDGSEPIGSSPAEYAAYIQRELQRWTDIVKTRSIKLN